MSPKFNWEGDTSVPIRDKGMLKNSVINSVAALIRLLLSVVSVPIIIHMIGLGEYGVWALVSAVISIVGLLEGGIPISTTFFVSSDLALNDRQSISETISISIVAMLILATGAALGLWIGAPFYISFIHTLSDYESATSVVALKIGAVVIWSRLLQQVFVGIEQAYQQYGTLNLLGTLQALFSTITLLVVVWAGGRSTEMMMSLAVWGILTLIAHVLFVRYLMAELKLTPYWTRKKAVAIGRYSLSTWVTVLGGTLFSQFDRAIVGGLMGMVPLGIYAALTSITMQINSISAISVQPLLPTLSNLLVNKQTVQDTIVYQAKLAFQTNLLIALGLGGWLIMFAPWVLEIVLPGPATSTDLIIFRILLLIYALYSINAAGYYILFSLKALNYVMIIQLISGIFSLLLIAIGAGNMSLVLVAAGNIGYLGVSLNTYWGMKLLTVPTSTWLKWALFPLLWLFIIVAISAFDTNIVMMFCIAVVLSSVLIIWFMHTNKLSFNLLTKQFVERIR